MCAEVEKNVSLIFLRFNFAYFHFHLVKLYHTRANLKINKNLSMKIKTYEKIISLVSRYRLKMISRKAIYAIIAALIYAILVTAYFKFPKDLFKEKEEDKKCNSKSPCIRFCLKDENRTNLWLFNLYNTTILSKRKKDGFNYVLDVDASEDDTVVKKEPEKSKKKDKDKKKGQDIPDYGAGDYTYADVGREQKMKGKNVKREVKDLGEDQDYDFDDLIEEPLTKITLANELSHMTNVYDFNYSNYDESQRGKRQNMSDEMNETNLTESREVKIKILRDAPKCIDRTIEDPFYDFRLAFVS
jgi:hypothetical protein